MIVAGVWKELLSPIGLVFFLSFLLFAESGSFDGVLFETDAFEIE